MPFVGIEGENLNEDREGNHDALGDCQVWSRGMGHKHEYIGTHDHERDAEYDGRRGVGTGLLTGCKRARDTD